MAEKEKPKRVIKEPSYLDAIIPILLLVVLIILAQIFFGDESVSGPFQVALIVCALVAGLIAYKNGHALEDVGKHAVDGISSAMGAIFILLAVGALIGTWSMAGTIATLTYYGVKLINPAIFYLMCAIICGLISMAIGSSWTTAGTIGVGLIAISQVLGLNPAIAAGAVISGSYFGDKNSPLSDTTNLAPAISGANLYTHIRATLWTSVPSVIISLVLFFIIGRREEVNATLDLTPALVALEDAFNISVLTLLPLVLVLFLAIRRVPAFVAIMMGALFGGVMAVILQPELVIAFADDPSLGPVLASIKAVWQAMATGFYAETGYPMIDDLVSRGGMVSMLGTVWLVLAAMGFGAIMDYTGSLRKLLTPVVKLARTAGQLMVATGLTSIFLNIFAGDQYMAVVLPGTLFRDEFEKRNIAPQMLSRQLVDTGTVTSPLVPWNTCGAYMAATLGVATVAYLPFCFFNYINPIVSFILDLLGIQIIKVTDDKAQEAYAPEPEMVSQYGISGYSVSKQAGGLAEQ